MIQAVTLRHSRNLILNLNAGVVSGLGAAVLLLCVCVFVSFLWRRYLAESNYYITDDKSFGSSESDWSEDDGAVSARFFLNHVSNLYLQDQLGFRRELEHLKQCR